MKNIVKHAALALLVASALACACGRPDPANPESPRPPAPLARSDLDVGLGCLAAGRTAPPLDALADDELAALAELVARLVAAYERADLDSFLALRWRDLDHANQARADRVAELRALCRQLGARPPRGAGWVGLLGAYWGAYYARPPVARFLPEGTVAELREEDVRADPAALARWDEGFDALHAGRPGSVLDHRLAVPHRRALAAVAEDPGPLRWLDLQLAFEAHDGSAGRLFARFAWDGATGEWFLHRATTLTDGERRDDARFLVL